MFKEIMKWGFALCIVVIMAIIVGAVCLLGIVLSNATGINYMVGIPIMALVVAFIRYAYPFGDWKEWRDTPWPF